MLPPERRLGRVQQLIDERKYFTLHAGRQTGKTTSLMWLKRHLNASGGWRALWVDLETAREQPDPAAALSSVLKTIDRTLRLQHAKLARPDVNEIAAALSEPTTALLDYLARLSALDERPLVLLFDEADGLVGPAMVSFLTQLRAGYIARSEAPFPSSVVLVGQRQVRDYVLDAEDRKAGTSRIAASPSRRSTSSRPRRRSSSSGDLTSTRWSRGCANHGCAGSWSPCSREPACRRTCSTTM